MASTRRTRSGSKTAKTKAPPQTSGATRTGAQAAAEAKPERAPAKPRPQAPARPGQSVYAKRARRKRDLINQVRDPRTTLDRAEAIYAELGGLEDVPALCHQEIARLG